MTDDRAFYFKNKYASLVKTVAREHGITPTALLGSGRARKIVQARADLAGRLDENGLSSGEIGMIIDRDHTTVLHLLGRTKKGKIYDEKFNRGGA